MTSVFGRTNREVGHRWIGLGEAAEDSWVSILPLETPVCVRGHAPWVGHLLRGRSDLLVATFSGFELERATSESHANDLTSALIVQQLSSLGRGGLDFLFLQVRRALEETTWSGLLGAVEEAREQGLVRYLGLEICGPVVGGLAQWRFHDAFEVVMAPGTPSMEWKSVREVAEERRVGAVATLGDMTEALRLSRENPVEFRPQSLQECTAWVGLSDN